MATHHARGRGRPNRAVPSSPVLPTSWTVALPGGGERDARRQPPARMSHRPTGRPGTDDDDHPVSLPARHLVRSWLAAGSAACHSTNFRAVPCHLGRGRLRPHRPCRVRRLRRGPRCPPASLSVRGSRRLPSRSGVGFASRGESRSVRRSRSPRASRSGVGRCRRGRFARSGLSVASGGVGLGTGAVGVATFGLRSGPMVDPFGPRRAPTVTAVTLVNAPAARTTSSTNASA